MKIINKYLVKTILSYIFITTLMWVVVFSLFDFMTDTSNIGNLNYTTLDSIFVLALKAPLLIYENFSVIALIGVILALGYLASTSQLVIARSIGMSIFTINKVVLVFATILFMLVAFIGEFYAQDLRNYGLDYKASKLGRANHINNSGFWLKDDNLMLKVGSKYDSKNFANIEIFTIQDNKLTTITSAKKMSIMQDIDKMHNDKKVLLQNVKTYHINNNDLRFSYQKQQIINLALDDKFIKAMETDPMYLSIMELFQQMRFLSNNNLTNQTFAIEFYKRMIKPLILITTILFATIFIFGSMRDTSMGKKLFLGIATSLVIEIYLRIGGAIAFKFDYNYLIIMLLPLLVFLGFVLYKQQKI